MEDNILIDDNYIQEMLKQYPLMEEENPTDLRDYTLDMVSELTNEEINIPDEFYIDFNPIVRKIKQKNIGACVGCSATASTMIMKGSDKLLSWWFEYANRKDTDFQGKGYFIRQALQHIKDDGITLLDLFNIMQEYPDIRNSLLNSPNKDEIFKEASKNKIGGYIKVEKEDVKRLISQGIPVMIGVKVFTNFYQAVNNNYVIPEIPIGVKQGNHEMVIYAYKGKDYKLLNWWDGIWDNDLWLNEDSTIINDLYIITDKPIIKPITKTYTIGWSKEASTGKWIYSEDGLTLVKDCWKQIKGVYYYFKDIYAVDGDWIKDKDNKYYYLEKGSCAMATDRWIYWIDKWYRVGKDGAMLTGWYQDDNTNWFYLDIEKGYSYTNCTILIDGKQCLFNSLGVWIENNDVSDDLFNFIKAFEGCYLNAYYCPSHVLTIGIGNTNPKWTSLGTITESQAMEAFKEDMKVFADGVDNLASNSGILLTSYQREALISFSFNVGLGALSSSTLWKNICNGVSDSDTITENFGRWNKGSDGVLEGLTRRRKCEARLYLTGNYSTEI